MAGGAPRGGVGRRRRRRLRAGGGALRRRRSGLIHRSAFFEGSVQPTGATVPWWRARTGNALIRRSSLGNSGRAVRPAPRLDGREDTDLFYRMIRSGARFIAVESARVVERRSRHRSSGWWMLRRSFRQGRDDRGRVAPTRKGGHPAARLVQGGGQGGDRRVPGSPSLPDERSLVRAPAERHPVTRDAGGQSFGLRYHEYGRAEGRGPGGPRAPREAGAPRGADRLDTTSARADPRRRRRTARAAPGAGSQRGARRLDHATSARPCSPSPIPKHAVERRGPGDSRRPAPPDLEAAKPGALASLQARLWQPQWHYVWTHSAFYRQKLGAAAAPRAHAGRTP